MYRTSGAIIFLVVFLVGIVASRDVSAQVPSAQGACVYCGSRDLNSHKSGCPYYTPRTPAEPVPLPPPPKQDTDAAEAQAKALEGAMRLKLAGLEALTGERYDEAIELLTKALVTLGDDKETSQGIELAQEGRTNRERQDRLWKRERAAALQRAQASIDRLRLELSKRPGGSSGRNAETMVEPSDFLDPSKRTIVVPNLAENPVVAKQLDLRIKAIEQRIKRLESARDLLSGRNPQWQKEWDRLHKDMVEHNSDLMWKSVGLLTAGLSEIAVSSAEQQVKIAKAAHQKYAWRSSQEDREAMARLAASLEGRELEIMTDCIARLDKLRSAEQAGRNVEWVSTARGLTMRGLDLARENVDAGSPSFKEAMYHFSLISADLGASLIGGLPDMWTARIPAGTVLKGAAKKAAPAAQLLDLAEFYLLIDLAKQDAEQLRAAADRSADRNAKFREVDATLADLEAERAICVHARDRSK